MFVDTAVGASVPTKKNKLAEVGNPYFYFNKFDDLISHVNDLEERDEESTLSGIEITPAGRLLVNGRDYATADNVVNSLAYATGYPLKAFKTGLSEDLLSKSINQLLLMQEENCIVRVQGDTAVGLYTYSKSRRVPTFLAPFCESLRELGDVKDKETAFRFKDGTLQALLINPDIVQPTPSDPSRIDVYVENGVTGYYRGIDSGFRLKRDACDNSTLLVYGSQHARMGGSAEASLDNFMEALPGMRNVKARLPDAYHSMHANQLKPKMFKEHREILEDRVGVRITNSILNSYYKTNKNDETILDQGELRKKNVYDLFNDITYNARALGLKEAVMQSAALAAGDILKVYVEKQAA